jgi:hypothetical protein
LHRLHIPQRFPHPDWSIADLWIAKELLRHGASAAEVKYFVWPARSFHATMPTPRTTCDARSPEPTHDIASAPFPARDAAVFTPSFSTQPSS